MTPGPYGHGTWNQDGTILFSGYGQALHRVSENGGTVRPVTVLDESREEFAHSFPVFLPDGRRFLYLAVKRGANSSELFQGSLDSTETRRVFASEANVGVAGRYLILAEQGRPGGAAVQSGSGGRDRRPDRNRRSHPFGSATPLGWSVLGGWERDCLQEREPEQPPALVRSRWTGSWIRSPRPRRRLPSSPAVAR